MKDTNQEIVQQSINTVRVLSADAVQKAESGHPGTPMALAPMGHVLWGKVMNYNPKSPKWPNRDRFILSAGHACMLQYSYLYLTGYDITLDDIKDFRQWESKTAGHPEYDLLDGVEVTTGPLGQGFANAVGFAVAEKHMAAHFNKPDFDLFNYQIYTICSDGDLMEGVTAEAASFAGTMELGNMVCLYDDNNISIEGDTDITFREDVAMRFESYGWHVITVENGRDVEALTEAIEEAKKETKKPTLIKVRTEIGYGSPNKINTAGAHGSPLGEDELRLVKEKFGFDPDKHFEVSDDVLDFYRKIGAEGADKEQKWNDLYKNYKEKYPELASEYEQISSGKLPEGWSDDLPVFKVGDDMATRKASGKVLNALSKKLPNLLGGSADLSPSTNTVLDAYDSFSASNYGGRNFHFGIREHAMGSILNGIALNDYLIPYGATFLIFSDYMRPPLRLAAIMKKRIIMVYTHDSIGLGEDGTTHQPVEQLAGLRSVPNMTVIRPADANETAHAWRVAIENTDGPVSLIFTRQTLPTIDQEKYGKASGVEKGAYVLSDSDGTPDVILIGTGSEVQLAVEAQKELAKENIAARVVSMPSWNLFEKQDSSYKESVFPKSVRKRVSIEAGSTMGWHKYVTDEGAVIGLDRFGESAPAEKLMEEFGFTVENVVKKAKALLDK
ncbi:transketolase [Flavimarina sp. Hel_I_48]|uniref:transketolase n=1 Tax=Flavimarina sp. Hel_I_48 TaxID=1392488 RepID=UPI0004DFA70B|nr:transketolase [Flavimarina sp. Hel_I_48]